VCVGGSECVCRKIHNHALTHTYTNVSVYTCVGCSVRCVHRWSLVRSTCYAVLSHSLLLFLHSFLPSTPSSTLSSVYSGFWKQGRRSGEGTQTYGDGFVYRGDWENDLRHGQGTLQADGFLFTYHGAWSMDLRHGVGQQVDPSGCYSGAWVRGQRSGMPSSSALSFASQSSLVVCAALCVCVCFLLSYR
jgi:MORN repeat